MDNTRKYNIDSIFLSIYTTSVKKEKKRNEKEGEVGSREWIIFSNFKRRWRC
jgi:hypothetical protein